MSKEINVYHLRTAATDRVIMKNGSDQKIRIGGVPYATVAITINEDGTVNRGISICSPHDAFVRSTGVAKAVGRMRKAEHQEANVFPILGFKRLERKIMKRLGHNCIKATPRDEVKFEHLGYFHDEPNEVEKRIFKQELAECKSGCYSTKTI